MTEETEEKFAFFKRIGDMAIQFVKDVDEYKRSLDKDKLQWLEDFLLTGENLDNLVTDGKEFLFTPGKKFPAFFEWKDELFKHFHSKFPDSTYGTYFFNNSDFASQPIALIVTMSAINKNAESILESLNLPQHYTLIDFEIFEKRLLKNATRNFDVKELLEEYEMSSEIDLGDIEDLAKDTVETNVDGTDPHDVINSLMYIDDIEKVHIKLAYGEDKIIPFFIGIGTNQPFGVRFKQRESEFGEDRYYKYDAINKFEEKFKLKKGKIVSFSQSAECPSTIFIDETIGNKTFAVGDDGIIFSENYDCKKANVWYKAELNKEKKDITQIQIKDQENFIEEKLHIFPDYDEYRQVFFDPIRIVKAMSNDGARKYLKRNGLLGEGTWENPEKSHQSLVNVASDIYNNGMFDGYRLRPSILFLLIMIKTRNFRENVINLANAKPFNPLK